MGGAHPEHGRTTRHPRRQSRRGSSFAGSSPAVFVSALPRTSLHAEICMHHWDSWHAHRVATAHNLFGPLTHQTRSFPDARLRCMIGCACLARALQSVAVKCSHVCPILKYLLPLSWHALVTYAYPDAKAQRPSCPHILMANLAALAQSGVAWSERTWVLTSLNIVTLRWTSATCVCALAWA